MSRMKTRLNESTTTPGLDTTFQEFLRDYLRLSPEKRAFAERVMQRLDQGLSAEAAAKSAAH